MVAIRSDHGMWMPQGERVRANKWYKFIRHFSDGEQENRYIREIIYGKRREVTYWFRTTDTENLPENSTSFVMTSLQEKRITLKKILGDLYGLRTWIEYCFRQCKQELGWKDYRFTKSEYIEKWWEIINSVYLMISLSTKIFTQLPSTEDSLAEIQEETKQICHPDWREFNSWKNSLNNGRIMIQPMILFFSILPWLNIIKCLDLLRGFNYLLGVANQYMINFPSG